MPSQQGFAEVNGARLYYEAAGAGTPLIFVHGFTLDQRMWDDQFGAFSARYHTIRYDARGFGRSSLPDGGSYRHADDLQALLLHLGVGPAHIVGLSMGGGIAIDFALTHPDATRSLIPVDSVLGGFAFAGDSAAARARRQAAESGVEAARELWLESDLFAPALERPGVAARLRGIVSGYSGWHWLNADPQRPLEPPAAQRLGKIRAPTLVVVGERDLPDFQRIAELLEQDIADARRVVLPGAGHMANMEEPARFNEVLSSFVERN